MSDNIKNFVHAVVQKDFDAANDHFGAEMQSRMADRFEQEKINVASGMFNDVNEEE
jgi:hypothetical protein